MGLLDRLRKKQPHLQAQSDVSKPDAGQPSSVSSATVADSAQPVAIAAATSLTGTSTHAAEILLKPLVTEKSTMTGTYVFAVAANANKSEVKKAFQTVYGVHPLHVRIINVSGKAVRFGGRSGKRADWKKAIVRLPADESISVYKGT